MDLMLPLFVPYGDCSLSQENVRDELKGQFGDNFLKLNGFGWSQKAYS